MEESESESGVARDRRGRERGAATRLLERETALAAIDHLLRSSRAGGDEALMFVGHAGMGKTRLHEAALDRARTQGFLVIRSAGAELEQNVAFGVAGELLRSLLAGLPAEERDTLLANAPERVNTLHSPDADLDPTESHEELAVSHGLFSLLAAALESRTALLTIDDLQWADTASLEFVLYLLHRLSELPLALLLTARPVEDEDGASVLNQIGAHPHVRTLELSPLGREAVQTLVSDTFGEDADGALIDACLERTAGNPFYLHELLLALAAEPSRQTDQLLQRANAMAPDAVARSLRVRVARLGRDAAALARAVAILGDDAPVRQAAALAGLAIPRASSASVALAGADILLDREPLRFVHPLVRHAIALDIPASQRATRHLQAARLLYADGESPERVAAHLLLGRAEGDPWVVERLQAAAQEARSRGATQSAVRYLERALAEPPSIELRGELLAALGAAEATLGLQGAEEHLRLAEQSAATPYRRAELALGRGRALYAQGLHGPGARAFEDGLEQLAGAEGEAGPDLEARLQTGFVSTAWLVPRLQPAILELSDELLAEPIAQPHTRIERLRMARAALCGSLTGRPAQEVIELATLAWDRGQLLEQETAHGVSWILVTSALCLAGDLERSLEVAEAAVEDARRRGAPLAFATGSFMRGLPQLLAGWIDGAVFDLELARDARRYGWKQFARAAAGHYCLALSEAGEPERAEAVLTEDAPLEAPYDLEDAIRLWARAELRRHQNRPEEALELALAAGETAEQTLPFVGYCPWRATAAQAANALGDSDRARALAAEELARAEQTGVLHERIRALRVAGVCEGGNQGLAKLRQAVELGATGPTRLETVYALIDLGSALRRSNERAASRAPLQQAADLARQAGANRLHELARTELAASGGRPRREALLTGPDSLTPSERRIAQLAAQGASNREIASALFVTPKTVEYHLRNSYRKLDIRARGELASALGV